MGLGTVGSGAAKILVENQEEICSKVGARFILRRVAVRDVGKARGLELPAGTLTTDAQEVIDDPKIDIVCELIGGVEPARGYVEQALLHDKSVVTANKEMIAKVGYDLMQLADRQKVDFLYEGSVAGGIPIIQPLKQALAGNSVSEIVGIVNGTTNYILSKMASEGAEFADVLAEAQAKGYAEADPASDVEGWDAQYKIAILASIAFNTRIDVADVTAEGITRLTKRDFDVAQSLGYTIKLVGIGTCETAGVRVRVHPVLLPKTHPLASVNDVYNAVYVRGNAVGDVMFYGRGAGSGPTGSAVVGDIIEIGRNMLCGATGRLGGVVYEERPNLSMSTLIANYYVRLTVLDKPRVLASIASVFGDFDVSIDTVDQRLVTSGSAELVLLTHKTIEHNLRSALEILSRLPVVHSVDNWIRIEK